MPRYRRSHILNSSNGSAALNLEQNATHDGLFMHFRSTLLRPLRMPLDPTRLGGLTRLEFLIVGGNIEHVGVTHLEFRM